MNIYWCSKFLKMMESSWTWKGTPWICIIWIPNGREGILDTVRFIISQDVSFDSIQNWYVSKLKWISPKLEWVKRILVDFGVKNVASLRNFERWKPTIFSFWAPHIMQVDIFITMQASIFISFSPKRNWIVFWIYFLLSSLYIQQ